MNKDISNFQWEESRIVKRTQVEEYINIDESLIELEKNNHIVRMELNSLELPLFSKDKRRVKNQTKKYYFKSNGSSYLQVEPGVDLSIPGEFEERVFISLIKVMRNRKYGKTFIVSANEILENLNLSNSFYYKKIRDSMKVLTKTNYTFKNSFYSNNDNGILDEEINATIMNIRRISKTDKESNKIEHFTDGRIQEVYEVSLSEYFYNNIIRKGYLAFDSEKLLEIKNATTRSIYQMIEKWRGYNLYLKRPAFHIARRVPLKWDEKRINRTINTIEKSCLELKELGLIKSFNKIKNGKLVLTEIEFFFDEIHNKIKRQSFYEDKNFTNELEFFVTHTEHKDIDKKNIEDAKIILTSNKKLSEEELKEIKLALPKSTQNLKTIDRVIKEFSSKYDFKYLLRCAEYTKLNADKNYRSYFISTVEKNWAEEYIAKIEEKNKSIIEKAQNKNEKEKEIKNKIEIEEKLKNESNKILNLFNSLDEKQKNKIENIVYEKYKKDGKFTNDKLLNLTFKTAKNGLIISYLSKNQEVLNELKSEINSSDKILVLNKKYFDVSGFLLDLYEKLVEIEIEPVKIEGLLKIIPILGKTNTQVKDYFITAEFDKDTKLGTLEIVDKS